MGGKNSKPRKRKGKGSARFKPPQNTQKVSHLKLKPKFTFEHIDKDYNLQSCSDIQKVKLISKLMKLGTLTWNELRQNRKHSFGCEVLSLKEKGISRPRFITEDMDDLTVFRFDGKTGRLCGIQVDEVFHVVFIDSSQTLYDHGS